MINENDDVVTPYEVKAKSDDGIDYNRLVETFGTQIISQNQLDRIEKLSGKKPHHLLRRQQFFCRRDLDLILDSVEKSKETNKIPFYLYTGRGPSASSLHIGHVVPLLFTKYLQDAFNVPLVIMLSDDEKYAAKNMSIDEIEKITYENIKDLIALGFNLEKTYIFSNFKSMSQNPNFYKLVCQIQKNVTFNQIKGIFGFNDSTNIGLISYTAVECAPSFCGFIPETFEHDRNVRCLIPCAIDQDPFFRMSRDVATKLKYPKPALLLSKFIPGLKGLKEKMSSSNQYESAVLLSDTPKEIEQKIKKIAFSGGKSTIEEHRKFGGDCNVDISFIYLEYFLEDDNELEDIRKKYTSGELLSGDLKKKCIEVLKEFILKFQEARSNVTKEVVDKYISYRKL